MATFTVSTQSVTVPTQSVTVPTRPASFELVPGSKLHVPEESLPSGVSEYRISIKASLSGQFQLPEDTELLSPVFWISTSCRFTKPVTLEIQHCAFREDEAILSGLSFVAAESSQRELPYRFMRLDGGVFTKLSSYGSIQLTHLHVSGVGVGIAGRKGTPRSYCAHVYHTMKQKDDWRFYFIITQDLELHSSVSSLIWTAYMLTLGDGIYLCRLCKTTIKYRICAMYCWHSNHQPFLILI